MHVWLQECPKVKSGMRNYAKVRIMISDSLYPWVCPPPASLDPSPDCLRWMLVREWSIRLLPASRYPPVTVKHIRPVLCTTSRRVTHLHKLVHSHSTTRRPPILEHKERDTRNPQPMSGDIRPPNLRITLIPIQPGHDEIVIWEYPMFHRQVGKEISVGRMTPVDMIGCEHVDTEVELMFGVVQ